MVLALIIIFVKETGGVINEKIDLLTKTKMCLQNAITRVF
jgi:hypothetical protein